MYEDGIAYFISEANFTKQQRNKFACKIHVEYKNVYQANIINNIVFFRMYKFVFKFMK